jgi:hypothetical protein
LLLLIGSTPSGLPPDISFNGISGHAAASADLDAGNLSRVQKGLNVSLADFERLGYVRDFEQPRRGIAAAGGAQFVAYRFTDVVE